MTNQYGFSRLDKAYYITGREALDIDANHIERDLTSRTEEELKEIVEKWKSKSLINRLFRRIMLAADDPERFEYAVAKYLLYKKSQKD